MVTAPPACSANLPVSRIIGFPPTWVWTFTVAMLWFLLIEDDEEPLSQESRESTTPRMLVIAGGRDDQLLLGNAPGSDGADMRVAGVVGRPSGAGRGATNCRASRF